VVYIAFNKNAFEKKGKSFEKLELSPIKKGFLVKFQIDY